MEEKDKLFEEARKSYKQLGNINIDDVNEALDVTYENGMSLQDLTRASYRYLFPVEEPSLYK